MNRPKIFISHKVLDRKLVFYFQEQLLKIGVRADEIYLSEETPPGSPWSPGLLQALEDSDILVFLYTDPSYDWDWCLFECGYFAALPPVNGQDRTLVCINSGIGRPSPLNLWQDISSEQALENFLRNNLAARLNSTLLDRPAVFLNFVKEFWTSIFSRLPLAQPAPPEAFRQRRLAIVVPPDEMLRIKAGQAFTDLTKVEISDGSRTIFPNAPLEATWTQFQLAIRGQPLQQKWMDSIPVMVRILNGVRTHSPMLPLVRDGLDSNIAYRPSVAQRDMYGDESVRYTIVFIRTPDATVASADAFDRLFVWLTLARNFREAVLNNYKKKRESIRLARDLQQWVQDFQGEIKLAQIDAESRGMDIQEDRILFCKVAQESINNIMSEWGKTANSFEELLFDVAAAVIRDDQKDHETQLITRKRFEDSLSKAKDSLMKMDRLNAEFTMIVSAALFGNIVRPQ